MERDWKSSTINEIERLRDWNLCFVPRQPRSRSATFIGYSSDRRIPPVSDGRPSPSIEVDSTLSAAGCTRPSARLVVI